jgi:hypothetical protein
MRSTSFQEPRLDTRTETKAVQTHRGSCHCGAVRFEADLSLQSLSKCNCSICTKINGAGCFAQPAAFRLLAGEPALAAYAWGAKISTRYFCKHCGVHCFGRGHLAELGGDFVSINVNALDDVDPATLPVVFWDGRHDNWHSGSRDAPWPVFAEAKA